MVSTSHVCEGTPTGRCAISPFCVSYISSAVGSRSLNLRLETVLFESCYSSLATFRPQHSVHISHSATGYNTAAFRGLLLYCTIFFSNLSIELAPRILGRRHVFRSDPRQHPHAVGSLNIGIGLWTTQASHVSSALGKVPISPCKLDLPP